MTTETIKAEETVILKCYCCEEFTEHTTYEGQNNNTFYECLDCGCVIDDSEDEVIYPNQKEKNENRDNKFLYFKEEKH